MMSTSLGAIAELASELEGGVRACRSRLGASPSFRRITPRSVKAESFLVAVAGLACGGQELLGMLARVARWQCEGGCGARPTSPPATLAPTPETRNRFCPSFWNRLALGHRDLTLRLVERARHCLRARPGQVGLPFAALSRRCAVGKQEVTASLGCAQTASRAGPRRPELAAWLESRSPPSRTGLVRQRPPRGRRCRRVPSTGSSRRGRRAARATRRFPSEIGSGRIPSSKAKSRQSGRFIRVALTMMTSNLIASVSSGRSAGWRYGRRSRSCWT